MILRLVNNPLEYESVELPANLHIHQRIDEIVYKTFIDDLAVPLSYLDSTDILAKINLSLVDRSVFLPENSLDRTFISNNYEVIQSSSYTTVYPELWITNKTITDSFGNQIPLFYAFELPVGTTNIKVERVTNKGSIQVDFGYLVDTDLSRIYFNFNNEFNLITGAYALYFVTATSSEGVIIKGLINPVSTIREATWEDIDPDTGDIDDSFVFFYRETNPNNYTFFFNKNDTIYIKPKETSVINPLEFPNQLSISGWFPRFSTGEFRHTGLDSITRRYYIPEYDSLSFFPSRPYFFDSAADVLPINSKIIYLGRKNLATNTTNRPIDIVISDPDGTALYAFTTKSSKVGSKYSSSIDWSGDEIASWDNLSGLVELTIDIKAEWEFQISYYYEVKELLYTYTNLNPLQNSLVYNHYYVYYLKPDEDERSVHHLLVRNDGVIVDTSDSEFALLDEAGAYNPFTFIGLIYRNSLNNNYLGDDWVTLFSVEGINSYQWLILAEYFFVEKEKPVFIDAVDVRRPGNVLNPDKLEDAVYRNPALYHCEYAATPYGTEYPQNNAYVLRASYSLLEEFGGIFTLTSLTEILRTYVAAGKYLLIEWDETIRNLLIDNTIANQITLTWDRVGFGFCYKIFRATSLEGTFIQVGYICSDYNQISFTDTSLDTSQIYYYYVLPTKDGIDYVKSYIISAQVR